MYTSNYGLLELRAGSSPGISTRCYGVRYDPKTEMLITVGVSEALDLALRAILDPGDEVIVPDPGYVSYAPCVMLAGGDGACRCRPASSSDFEVTRGAIEARSHAATKAILLGYPNNPTGAVLPRASWRRIAEVAERHDLLVISDEIYDRLIYDGEHTCFAALPGMRERTILLGGFSKAYAMTGWRVGYAAAPAEILEA